MQNCSVSLYNAIMDQDIHGIWFEWQYQNRPDFDGPTSWSTPLHACVMRPFADGARFFLAQGIPVDARDGKGDTPLIQAVQVADRAEMVRLLLDNKADPNAVDGRGRTALHYAALLGRKGITDDLLRSGADPGIKDVNGKTALDLAGDRFEDDLRTSILKRDREALSASIASTFDLPPPQRSQSARRRM